MLEAATLWDLIVKRADATPDAPMVVDETRTTLTFAAYRDAAQRAAAGLYERGVKDGVVVTWILPTTNNSVVLVGALARLGATQNPVLPIYRDREVGFISKQARPQLLIVPSVYRDFDFEAMAQRVAGGAEVLVCDGPIPEGDPTTLPPPPSDGDAVRWLFYTSGSTADPKGARHTDRTIMATARGMGERLAVTADDRNGLVFPFTHIAGPIWLATGLMVGLRHLIVSAWDPPTTIPFFQEQDVTIAGSGTIFHMGYLTAQRENPNTPLFPNVRCFPGGGAPKPPQLAHEIKKEMGAPILSGYGLTEAPILTMASFDDSDEALANTEGTPMTGVELKLVTLEGDVAGPGEEGEIRAKAPQLMKGYLDAALDAEAFDEDGYFRTGDLGKLVDGNIVITGRVKDIIIRKGENISAKEVEDLLFTHPGVSDVAVIGLPDPSSGERACAIVVGELSFDDMVAFLKDKGLRNQAIPEQLEIADALPRNPAGKVLKQDLKREYA
ncbi:MAG TPA: AMP-binding protein [Actinomycetota bacterium]|jgi:acyl-CoA synthetase (AMP-forming)/AMP-acid ligase II|nr:AMP-binding protein [Actinomycetota bacterium]